jgi:hypothetical protein
MSKVKKQIVLSVRVPGYEFDTPITIGYEDIWSWGDGWMFQRWLDYCKMYVNVQGRCVKDGSMSCRRYAVAMSHLANEYYHKAIVNSIHAKVLEYE